MSGRRAAVRRVALALVAAELAACAAPQGQVVLLPERDGKATSVVVTQPGGELVLSQPYAAASLTRNGPQPATRTPAEVQARFGAAMAALPLPPTRFTLYFVEGKDEFTDESRRQIDAVFAEIARRPLPDVVVIGHTDRVGSDEYNDTLSRQRAEVARQALVLRGLAPEQVVAVGRGKRELAVPTADGVAEARNRRVEIQVR